MTALSQDDSIDMFLLLNPDALLARGAMSAFRERLAQGAVGLCGGSVLRFDAPHEIQALGGARLTSATLLEKISVGTPPLQLYHRGPRLKRVLIIR